MRHRPQDTAEQLDLFVALLTDAPLAFRDDREAMSAPMVSLAKNPRQSLKWKGPQGQTVLIETKAGGGIATIWDYDLVIWAISRINDAIEKGMPHSPTVEFRPYDIMKALGRNAGGKGYGELEAALDRLQNTNIRTNIRGDERSITEGFSLITQYRLIQDKAGRPMSGRMTLPDFFYEAILARREILSISPDYFKLTSGIDRFLYRLARRHAGNGRDNPDGWIFSFADLRERSGSPMKPAEWARELRKAISRDKLPTYTLTEEIGAGGAPMLRLHFRRLAL